MTNLYTYQPNDFQDGDHSDWLIVKNEPADNPEVVASACTETLAKRICALPDLLEALQDCITDDGASCIVTHNVAYMIRRFHAINEIARAAIAKAEGTDSP